MKLARRKFLRLAAGVAVAPALTRLATALDYPTRPVKLVIGFAPGGPADIVARLLGQFLSEQLGQPFVIENRPGAGTTIATETVVRSPPDGYTLLWTTSADEINATLYQKLNYDFTRDIVPVASIDLLPLVMEVNPAFAAKTVPEFIANAKANPGKINFASGGIGSSQHVAGELFDFMTGVNMVHVPYRGAALAINDLLAGQVQVTFSPIPLVARIHSRRQAAPAGGDQRDADAGAARRSHSWLNSCQVTKRSRPTVSVHLKARRRRSLRRSIRRSMRRWPTRKSRRGWKVSAACPIRCRLPISESSLPPRPTNGQRW